MKEALLAEGFKPFVQNCLGHEHAVANYQKCFTNRLGKRYFITVFEYDHSNLSGWPQGVNPISFQFEAQFHKDNDEGLTVDITASAKDASELPNVLTMFDKVWKSLGSVYYEL